MGNVLLYYSIFIHVHVHGSDWFNYTVQNLVFVVCVDLIVFTFCALCSLDNCAIFWSNNACAWPDCSARVQSKQEMIM